MRTKHVTEKSSQVIFKFGLFGPRFTYYANKSSFDTLTISLFFVMIYIRFNKPHYMDNIINDNYGNYGFYCMSKPDMFIIEWGNRLLKRIEMPWIKVIKERHLKLAKKTQYLKLFNPNVDVLFDVIESNKELYVESNEMWGCKYEYFVIKNVYVLNMFKEQNLCRTTKYEIHVTLNNLNLKGNNKFIIEIDNDENITEDIGAHLLELFMD